jgi:hypothetical protein
MYVYVYIHTHTHTHTHIHAKQPQDVYYFPNASETLTVSVTCNEGFRVAEEGSLSASLYTGQKSYPVNCSATCEWTGPFPQCAPGICPTVEKLFGDTLPDGMAGVEYPDPAPVPYMGTIKVNCKEGYGAQGNADQGTYEVTCMDQGYDVNLTTLCERVNCGTYVPPSGGTVVNPKGTRYGDVATYTCAKGFHIREKTCLEATQSVTCTAQGDWEYGPPCIPASPIGWCDFDDTHAVPKSASFNASQVCLHVCVCSDVCVCMH